MCTKFRGNACFVPRSHEFECQGQRSRSLGKTRSALPSLRAAATEWKALVANVTQQRTAPFRRCQGVISAACVRCMFGKTSLALVLTNVTKRPLICDTMKCFVDVCKRTADFVAKFVKSRVFYVLTEGNPSQYCGHLPQDSTCPHGVAKYSRKRRDKTRRRTSP